MNLIFADTQGWVALSSKRDRFHQQAVMVNKQLISQHNRFLTTNFVLDETYTLLLRRIGHSEAVKFGEMIRRTPSVEVIHITEAIEARAWELFKQYSDKEFSFTDCTSFVVMQQLGLTETYTNDHHFEQMRFTILLK
ncbi:type II toxin-antitoxin system VapC family toxin [bacterium]|nr:type II toxin-antitoxin system VapC family toxin [bacterium]